MADSPPPLLRPLPRRPFELSSLTPSEGPDSPTDTEREPPTPDERRDVQGNLTNGIMSDSFATSRSKSWLNLTSSTLLGIYSPTQNYDAGSAYPSEPATPWGTGAETPARHSIDDGRPQWPEARGVPPEESIRQQVGSSKQKAGKSAKIGPGLLASAGRTVVLFLLGIAYGALVSHLHDSQHIAPVHISNINRASWTYILFWGVAGVVLGSLLPYLDSLWRREPAATSPSAARDNKRRRINTNNDTPNTTKQTNTRAPADWTLAVRSIGAFVGIAFAIRKLPWQSTLQVSATLALANPALWYLLDRTKPGFLLSASVGTLGTLALLLLNPGIVPEPGAAAAAAAASASAAGNASAASAGWAMAGRQWLRSVGGAWQGQGQGQGMLAPGSAAEHAQFLGGMLSYESVGVATWLGSVLFCSSICFGNVGRKMGI